MAPYLYSIYVYVCKFLPLNGTRIITKQQQQQQRVSLLICSNRCTKFYIVNLAAISINDKKSHRFTLAENKHNMTFCLSIHNFLHWYKDLHKKIVLYFFVNYYIKKFRKNRRSCVRLLEILSIFDYYMTIF